MLNQPLGGLRVIEGNPLYEDRTEGMGAVAAYTYGEHTVVFVGTRSGQLKKVRLLQQDPLWPLKKHSEVCHSKKKKTNTMLSDFGKQHIIG